MENKFSFDTKILLFLCGGMTDIITFLISVFLLNLFSNPIGIAGATIAITIDYYFTNGETIFTVLMVPFIISMFTGLIFFILLQISNVKISLVFYIILPFLVILSSIPFLNTYFYWTTFAYYLLGRKRLSKK